MSYINSDEIKRGKVYWVNLGEDKKRGIQCGQRPCIVLSNDIGNKYSPTVLIAPITSANKNNIPTHVAVKRGEMGMQRDSTVLLEQIKTVEKDSLNESIGTWNKKIKEEVEKRLLISFGIIDSIRYH